MLRKVSSIALALALSACASTEGLSDSAIGTNLEFEEIQNKTLLLNVVRTSLRRPPVYHSLQNVTGTVRPSGDLSVSIPFGMRVSSANSATLSLKGNEGPKITSAPLDTQEFYQGIMAPIKPSTIDFYVQQGYPKGLLYNLFFGRVELRRKGAAGITITNYPTDDNDVDRFQVLVNHLMWLGFTTEPVTGTSLKYGPSRTREEVADLAATAGAATAGLSVSEVKEEICKKKTKKGACLRKVEVSRFRVAKPIAAPSAKFCFRPPASDELTAAPAVEKPRTCDKAAAEGDKVSLKWKHLSAVFDTSAGVCGTNLATDECQTRRGNGDALRKALCGRTGCTDETEIELSFVVRSTDGIIYYLGEVARRQLYPDISPARPLAYRRKPNAASVPCEPKDDAWLDDDCYAIFWVEKGHISSGEIASIEYEGSSFSVPGRVPGPVGLPHPGERSSQVFGIVTQLLGLNKSAKDQPATSILNVVSP